MIQFDQEVCADLAQASSREWLETNGIGGFASSTIAGLNTRRYHGLLIAATHPPVGRSVLLSKLEETLIVAGERVELATNQYPGTVHPAGFTYLKQFRLDPYPVFKFEWEGNVIEKHVCMLYGENTVIIQYRVINSALDIMRLELRPLIAFRDYHSLTHKNERLNPKMELSRNLVSMTPYGELPTLHLAQNADSTRETADWYYSFQYTREQERGLDFSEDLFNPLCFEFELTARHPANVIASTEVHDISKVESLTNAELDRRNAIGSRQADGGLKGDLCRAADQFIVRRDEHKTVIAGYHWFGDWGRDTMIALPGLCLATGRIADARDILLEFAQHVDQGMLPNRFPEAVEKPEYNTVDATLWYFESIRAYHASTGDDALLTELFPILREIVDWHVRGTRYDIRVDEDGLLNSGPQLTWMDAKIGDWIVTPRAGKAVEIQALWYNALRIMEEFAASLGIDSEKQQYETRASRARESFNREFWNADGNYLFDVVTDSKEASLRPNQIFAVSLHHSILDKQRSLAVVEKVRKELLTPYGLRTLSPLDPKYIGRYRGDQRSRDAAYHQGTVWPWLLGPFVQACLKVYGNDASARSQITQWLSPIMLHLSEAGLGTVSEIFEGDAPHAPCGCIAQAWSVGELIRSIELAGVNLQ